MKKNKITPTRHQWEEIRYGVSVCKHCHITKSNTSENGKPVTIYTTLFGDLYRAPVCNRQNDSGYKEKQKSEIKQLSLELFPSERILQSPQLTDKPF